MAFKMFLLLLYFALTNGHRITIFPFGTGGSHLRVLQKLAGELHSKGHEINFIMAKDNSLVKDERFNYRFYTETVKDQMENLFQRLSDINNNPSPSFVLSNVITISSLACQSILDNPHLMSIIQQSDLIITETLFFCGSLIAESVNIPRVDFLATMITPFGHLYKFPFLPSYIPETLTMYSDVMIFPERIINTMTSLVTRLLIMLYIEQPMNGLQKRLSINSKKDFMEIFSKPSAIIFQGDFAIEYAQPILPNVHYIGPILPEEAKPLQRDLEDFMNNAGINGIIIVSFGSYFELKGEVTTRMIKALGRLEQSVIWSTKIDFKDLPSNIETLPWIPQNDLLGHRQTKLFISHSGHNSAYEAAYHGVPMIAVPLALDQPYVANKLINKAKMAAMIDIRNDSDEKWYQVINHVLTNPWYQSNASKVSQLIKNRASGKTPAQEASLIIEASIQNQFQINHYYKSSTQLNFVTENGYDVALFFVMLIALLIYGINCAMHVCKRYSKHKLD